MERRIIPKFHPVLNVFESGARPPPVVTRGDFEDALGERIGNVVGVLRQKHGSSFKHMLGPLYVSLFDVVEEVDDNLESFVAEESKISGRPAVKARGGFSLRDASILEVLHRERLDDELS